MPVAAQEDVDKVHTAILHAVRFYHQKASLNGGYVYHYSPDLKDRWGEGRATPTQVWVQPPGTPTVGEAFLDAFEATRDPLCLTAALDAGRALQHGQLKSGGWRNLVDFDPRSRDAGAYRNGRGKGRNQSSLDDGQSQSALKFLFRLDRVMEQKDPTLHEAAMYGLKGLLATQFPNGGWPQVWEKPATRQSVVQARFPDHDWRTEGRVKNYWDMYTLNDNVMGYVVDALLEAHRTYAEDRIVQSIRKAGDFLIVAQMPEPQPGWAQQYNLNMEPIWARRFEPPGVSGDETQEAVETLLKIHEFTRDDRYLRPIPAAMAWLKRSRLPDGQLARYYELKTNRPLYMERVGDDYRLTHDDSNLPSHYGWKTEARLEQLESRYQSQLAGKFPDETKTPTAAQVARLLQSLDSQGRWISRFDGQRLVGQFKLAVGTPYLSSEVFAFNIHLLSAYLQAQP